MATDLVTALWIGSHDAELPDRRTLRRGQDTARIPRAEAETSDNWQIVEKAEKHAKAAKAD